MAVKQFPIRHVLIVPNLLGNESAGTGLSFDHVQESLGFGSISSRELVMRPLACKQRPASSDAGSIEGASVLVLAITVVVVSMPDGTCRRFRFKSPINDGDGVHDARIIGCAQSKTNERESIRTDD